MLEFYMWYYYKFSLMKWFDTIRITHNTMHIAVFESVHMREGT